jgi:acyl-homoserine-lactone acylase
MRRRILAGVTVVAVLAAPAAAQAAKHYRAEIRRTTGGWAHVKAADYGSLGYGYGYAYAQDQICELEDIVTTVNAQRSRWFGPRDGNLESDFFYQRIKDERTVQRLAAKKAPMGPSKIVRQTVKGFAAGVNAYLRRTGRNHISDPTCRGKGWVRKITTLDLYRRFYQLGLRASSGNFMDEIVAAQPPGGATAAAARRPDPHAFDKRLGPAQMGSNAYGIGREGARGERSLVLGNPHFPWEGSERFYEVHLTIPGKINVIGAALQAVPVVNIGFNQHVAWSHTVSSARRFTPYELNLVPGRPTQYLVDGKATKMRARTVRVRVKAGDVRRHTFYETRWGPLFSFTQAGLTWGTEHAYALADVNARNFRLVNQWSEYDRATSVRGLRRAYRRVQGNPWVNTIGADSKGRAYYADESVVPYVDADLQQRCTAPNPLSGLLLDQGVVLLDGSRAGCRWKTDDDAIARGIIGPKDLPRRQRTDYVENSNDSYWLPSARFRIEGYPRIMGPEQSPRSLRTRMALIQAEQRLAGTDRLGPPGFTLRTLQKVVFGNRNLSAELAKRDTVAACQASGRADLAQACEVLRLWDGRAGIGERGEVLWREYWKALQPAPWLTAYDPADPVNTPTRFNPFDARVLAALTTAVDDLKSKGIPLDVPLGELQAEPRGSTRIPIPGCTDQEGCFNVISTNRDDKGRYDPYTGSSFVMTAAFDNKGRPHGAAVLSYSQSENPRSPHYADQTRLFSRRKWLRMRFTEGSIRRDRNYKRTVVTG